MEVLQLFCSWDMKPCPYGMLALHHHVGPTALCFWHSFHFCFAFLCTKKKAEFFFCLSESKFEKHCNTTFMEAAVVN